MSLSACSDDALFAALAKHPRCTAGSDGHPMPDRCRIEDLFDWPAVAKETQMSPEALLDATFGPGPRRAGLLRTRRASQRSPWPLTEEGRRQLGVLVIPDFVQEDEESRILGDFFDSGAGLPWEEREGGGYHASFGPTFIPKSGYKVDKSKAFTELPSALDSIRSRLQRLRFDDDGFGVAESLRRYAMSAAARGGRQGALSQAFVQRYELDGDETTCNRKQALGMHFDSRNANAEVVIGLSLGEDQGHIFFSRSGPHKGQPFPLSLAKALEERGDGMLVELPRRALYMFYGFARYHLRHGVPWHSPAGCAGYRRVTVTLRSVPQPSTSKRRGTAERGEDAKQRRLETLSFAKLRKSAAAPLEIDLTDV